MINELDNENSNLRDPESDLSVQPDFAKNRFRSKNPEFFVLKEFALIWVVLQLRSLRLLLQTWVQTGKEVSIVHAMDQNLIYLEGLYAGVPAPSNPESSSSSIY